MSVKNIWKVVGKSKGVGDVFQGGGASSGARRTNFGGIDGGDDHPHGPGPGGVPTQGISIDHWEVDLGVISR